MIKSEKYSTQSKIPEDRLNVEKIIKELEWDFTDLKQMNVKLAQLGIDQRVKEIEQARRIEQEKLNAPQSSVVKASIQPKIHPSQKPTNLTQPPPS